MRSKARHYFVASLLVLFGGGVQAQGRTEFLAQQLRTSDDFRVRTQAALALGATGDAAAVDPLCRGLDDTSDVVRTAAAAALAKLGRPQGAPCLRARQGRENNATTRAQIDKSLQALEKGGGNAGGGAVPSDARVYVAVGGVTNKTRRAPSEVESLVRSAMNDKLRAMSGYVVAPPNESSAAAKKVLADHSRLKAFHLQTTIEPPQYRNNALTVVVRVTMSTYPGKELKGEFAPKLTQSDTPTSDRASEDALIRMALEKALESFDKVVATMH
jgi:HEAT repeat protein